MSTTYYQSTVVISSQGYSYQILGDELLEEIEDHYEDMIFTPYRPLIIEFHIVSEHNMSINFTRPLYITHQHIRIRYMNDDINKRDRNNYNFSYLLRTPNIVATELELAPSDWISTNTNSIVTITPDMTDIQALNLLSENTEDLRVEEGFKRLSLVITRLPRLPKLKSLYMHMATFDRTHETMTWIILRDLQLIDLSLHDFPLYGTTISYDQYLPFTLQTLDFRYREYYNFNDEPHGEKILNSLTGDNLKRLIFLGDTRYKSSPFFLLKDRWNLDLLVVNLSTYQLLQTNKIQVNNLQYTYLDYIMLKYSYLLLSVQTDDLYGGIPWDQLPFVENVDAKILSLANYNIKKIHPYVNKLISLMNDTTSLNILSNLPTNPQAIQTMLALWYSTFNEPKTDNPDVSNLIVQIYKSTNGAPILNLHSTLEYPKETVHLLELLHQVYPQLKNEQWNIEALNSLLLEILRRHMRPARIIELLLSYVSYDLNYLQIMEENNIPNVGLLFLVLSMFISYPEFKAYINDHILDDAKRWLSE